MTELQRRRHLAHVRAVTEDDGTHRVTLRCVTPDVVDDYGSVWDAHAFDKSIKERLPALAWVHDWSEPLGRGVDYRLSDAGPEIIFEFDDFDDVPIARRAFSQVRSGTIQDCSVGFYYIRRRDPTDQERAKWEGVEEVIEEAGLDEVSLVLRGAVPGAKVLAIRSVGGSVEDGVLEFLAGKVAAGEMTEAEAKIALRLAADDTIATPPPPAPVVDVDLDSDVSEALDALDRQSVGIERAAMQTMELTAGEMATVRKALRMMAKSGSDADAAACQALLKKMASM